MIARVGHVTKNINIARRGSKVVNPVDTAARVGNGGEKTMKQDHVNILSPQIMKLSIQYPTDVWLHGG
jgi:hypothetical protein